MSRRAKRLSLVALLSLVSVGVAFGAASRTKSPQQQLAEVKPPEMTALTESVVRAVVTDALSFNGVLSVAEISPVQVPNLTGIVTRLPLAVGAAIKDGGVLGEVSGRPVIVASFDYPLYRDITPGVQGDDVRALQRMLRRRGHRTGADADGTYGRGTEEALTSFYEARGYDPSRTDSPSDDEVNAAHRSVADAQSTLDAAPDDTTRASARSALDRAIKARDEMLARRGVVAKPVELIRVSSLPATIDGFGAEVGSPVKDPFATLSSGVIVVKMELSSEKAALLKVGMKAKVRVGPDGLEASLVSLGSLKKPEAGGEPTVTAVVQFADPDAVSGEPTGASVPVEIIRSGTDEAVLAVPSSAVYTGSDGSDYVEMLKGSTVARVKITTGAIGGGLVEITSGDPDLVEGAKVVVGKGPAGSGGSQGVG